MSFSNAAGRPSPIGLLPTKISGTILDKEALHGERVEMEA